MPTGRGLLALALFAVLVLAYHLLEREAGAPDVGPSPAPGPPPEEPSPAEREELEREEEELAAEGEPGYGPEMPREPGPAEETARQDAPQGAIPPREGISAHPPARDAHERGALAGEAVEPELVEAGR